MAVPKGKTLIRLVSTAEVNGKRTGYFYVKLTNPKRPEKLKLKKYDPIARKHVIFEEKKIK